MTKFPNQEGLNKALNIYRSAMRSFIFCCLEKVDPKGVEELIVDSLKNKAANKFEQDLHLYKGNIEASIHINTFPHIIRNRWDDVFEQQFNPYSNVRNVISLIVDGRNQCAHLDTEDLDLDYTWTYLFLISDVLSQINRPDAKREIEIILDELFPDDTDERIADMTKQHDAAKAENAELEKLLKDKSDQLEEMEAERATYETRLETASFRLKITEAGKTVAEERLSDISNRFEEAEIENANLEKCLSETENRLRTVESEKDELKECLETTLTRLEDVEEELAGCKAEREEWNGKVVAPIPPIEFPYTGPQLRDYRIKAGLTQVAVVLALGLSKGAAAAVGDWEAERVKVPPKHYAKLKELYGLEVLPGNGKARKKKSSIAERYAAETTEEERNELAVKVAELRINEEGTQGLAWRKIREELNLKNDEFHKVIRHEDHYKESCIQRIESFEGGWEYGGKLEVLLGFDPVGELLDRIEACKPASKVEEPVKTEDPNEVPSYRGDTAKSPKRQRKWRRPGAVAALRDPAKIRQAEAKIANILNLGEKTRLERELREAKQAVYGSEI